MKPKPTTLQSSLSIAIHYLHPKQEKQAALLAEKLGLPVKADDEKFDMVLRYSERGLELLRFNDPTLTGSVRVDFIAGRTGYRRLRGGPEMLVRAIGHKKDSFTRVLDATGGLGRDAFIMAAHGCQVQILEKNLIAGALLQDGLERASVYPDTQEICDRISLTIGDSMQLLTEEKEVGRYDVIYLDPMFPKRSKSALVKKELQILQMLVKKNDDTEGLFKAALQSGTRRVVVKRPKTAPPLPGRKPSHSLSGKTTRFDVYLTT